MSNRKHRSAHPPDGQQVLAEQQQSPDGQQQMPDGIRPMRRLLAFSLRALHRLVAADFLLFVAAMVAKLYWFNKLLSVLYMDMTRTDAIIETGALLLAACWTLLLPTRGRILALVGLNLALSALLFADVVYYRYFQDLITVPVLLQIGQVESLGGSIHTLINVYDFWLFADIVLLLPYAVYVAWRGRADLNAGLAPQTGPSRLRAFALRVGSGAAAFALGMALFFNNVNHATETWAKGLFEKNWWNLSIYNVAGALGFHGYDVYRYAKLNWFGTETVTAEQKSEIELWINNRGLAREAFAEDALFGAYAGSNVVMVQLEALQSFMLNQSIGGQEITPVLNGLMRESAYFEAFYHQTAQGRTSDADFAANCSFLPMKSGSVFIQYASHEFACLPKTLKENGYAAEVFHAYQGGFWNRNVMYANMAYDRFHSLKSYEVDEPLGWSLGDKSFYRQSMDAIAELEQPFHAFLISLTSHHPYKLPAAQKKLDTEELDGTIMGDYLQAIHYADAALGELVARLKSEGLWDNTVFVVYGDHDNSIQDWELYGRFMNDPDSRLEREMTLKRVPLLIHLPDGKHAGAYDTAGGQLDIAPTLLHLLGISTRDKGMLGLPLLVEKDRLARLVVQRNGAWTDGARYYIPSEDGLPTGGQCYDAATGQLLDSAACKAGTEEAEALLMMSDRIVIHDLLRAFKVGGAVEALGDAHDGQ